VVQRFAELGTAPVPPEAAAPDALQQKLLSEIERWKPVIEEAGVYAE
jgi:tripartite-type tricarboxylate transporter receptor subunit TctC